MARKRFKKHDMGSFYGNFIYDRVVPRDHFLRRLEEIVPWEHFTDLLMEFYRGAGQYGRPPYNPVVILKMLLIGYLYNLSERATEQQVNDSLAMKWLMGLAVDEFAPDHSTLSRFRQRIVKNGKEKAFAEMLVRIVQLAQESRVEFGTIQVMDSVHTVADVNTSKDEGRKKKGKPPRDGGAAWGVKHKKKAKDENGKTVNIPQYFYGYKAHVSLNTGSELITSIKVTAGNAYDGHEMLPLIERDLEKGIPIDTATADKGYDDGENHYTLECWGIQSAIILKRNRTEKKCPNKQKWIAMKASEPYRRGIRERYKIERKFGEAKQGHGLSRCRYLGKIGYMVQAYLTAMVLNLKRLVKLLTGTNFRGRATAAA